MTLFWELRIKYDFARGRSEKEIMKVLKEARCGFAKKDYMNHNSAQINVEWKRDESMQKEIRLGESQPSGAIKERGKILQ